MKIGGNTHKSEIPRNIPLVVNLKGNKISLNEYNTLYIGRSSKNPNHFGNPFSHLPSVKTAIQVKTREQSIQEFEKWLLGTDHRHVEQDRRHWILKHLWKIKQAKKLGCFCAPLPCHGDILKKIALKAHPHIH